MGSTPTGSTILVIMNFICPWCNNTLKELYNVNGFAHYICECFVNAVSVSILRYTRLSHFTVRLKKSPLYCQFFNDEGRERWIIGSSGGRKKKPYATLFDQEGVIDLATAASMLLRVNKLRAFV